MNHEEMLTGNYIERVETAVEAIKNKKHIVTANKELIAKTVCDDDLFISIMPDTVIVKTKYRDSYGLYNKDIYMYLNDGKYTVERKECIK